MRQKLHVGLRQVCLPLPQGTSSTMIPQRRQFTRRMRYRNTTRKPHTRNELEPPRRPDDRSPDRAAGSPSRSDPRRASAARALRCSACLLRIVPPRRRIRARDDTGLELSSGPWLAARGKRNGVPYPAPSPRRNRRPRSNQLPFGTDLNEWPRSWMGFPKDVPPGEHIVACFRPFLTHLIQLQLSRKTLRKHVNNLWVLGGGSFHAERHTIVEKGVDRQSGL